MSCYFIHRNDFILMEENMIRISVIQVYIRAGGVERVARGTLHAKEAAGHRYHCQVS